MAKTLVYPLGVGKVMGSIFGTNRVADKGAMVWSLVVVKMAIELKYRTTP